MTAEFLGQNVRFLRTFRGWTVRELATNVSASPSAISAIERGREPKGDLLEAICIVLGVSERFLQVPIADEFTLENANFRRGHASAEKVRRRVLAQATLFSHVVNEIEKEVQLPRENVPRFEVTTLDDAERAAESVRLHWGFGLDRPISSVGRALENSGVLLTRLRDDESSALDAFSRSSTFGGRSYVVLNPAKGSASRQRFDMAHELGHLVMHSETRPQLEEREAQADRFASAFLLPRAGFLREFVPGGRVNWGTVFQMKARWGASAQAIVYRAKSLGLIDAVEARRAFAYFSSKGWRRAEPEEPPAEGPVLFRLAMSKLWETSRVGALELSERLSWTVQTFEDVTGFRSTPRRSAGPSVADPRVIPLFPQTM